MEIIMNEKNTINIQVLDRALNIMEFLADENHPKSIKEICSATNLNRTTTYRILQTLLARGYIAIDSNNHYFLGIKLVALASCRINNLELEIDSRPFLSQLSQSLGLSVYLVQLDKMDVVYLSCTHPHTSYRNYIEIGTRVPAYCTAHGKCLLAGFSQNLLHKKISTYTTENNITISIDNLFQELKTIREQGYATDDCEYSSEHRCVAAPIYDYSGEIIAALAISGSPLQVPLSAFSYLSSEAMLTANKISEQMGYTI